MFLFEEIRHFAIVDYDRVSSPQHFSVPNGQSGIFRKCVADHLEVMYQKNKPQLSERLRFPEQIHIISLHSVHRILNKEERPHRKGQES